MYNKKRDKNCKIYHGRDEGNGHGNKGEWVGESHGDYLGEGTVLGSARWLWQRPIYDAIGVLKLF